MKSRMTIGTAALALALAGCHGTSDNKDAPAKSGSAQVTGAGSTFVYPVLSAWASDYSTQTGTEINYQSIGSGGGIAQVKAGTVDFGATDQPLTPDELAKSNLAQFPIVIGGIVPVVNIAGSGEWQTQADRPAARRHLYGQGQSWNDPAIVKINPGVNLPATAIATVHRSDGSGTTFNFTHYLSQVSPGWKSGPGEGKTVAWIGGVGGKGNEGVAGYVKQTSRTRSAMSNMPMSCKTSMNFAQLQNAAGTFVSPSADSFSAAADSADWKNAQDFNLVMTNAPGANAYPITASTFMLVPKQPRDKAKSEAALAFFRYALEHGQDQAKTLDYVPLPDSLVKQIEAYIGASIK